MDFIRHSRARQHVIFLSDYDMLLTEQLVQGVDVWLNTPLRPWEACGTSGMKVLVNGGVNLSELDGWWAEAYSPELGWALGDGKEHDHDPVWDAAEAESLYGLLEREVIPEFYSRDNKGIPIAWVARMRESMAQLTPRFSTNRAVREYTEQHYLLAAANFRKRSADHCAVGKQIIDWQHTLEQHWTKLRFGAVRVQTQSGQHVFEAPLSLGDAKPEDIRVELYADGIQRKGPEIHELKPMQKLAGSGNEYTYGATISAARPASDYTARAVPRHDGVSIPLEANSIVWQR
jgi:starch phosphorylase